MNLIASLLLPNGEVSRLEWWIGRILALLFTYIIWKTLLTSTIVDYLLMLKATHSDLNSETARFYMFSDKFFLTRLYIIVAISFYPWFSLDMCRSNNIPLSSLIVIGYYLIFIITTVVGVAYLRGERTYTSDLVSLIFTI